MGLRLDCGECCGKWSAAQEVADLKIALDLQKVEQTGVGTAHQMDKILKEEKDDADANEHRTTKSGKASFHPVRAKKN